MTALNTALIAPWSVDTPALLTQTLSHVATATVVLPSGETIPVALTGGTVGWDETRAPRVQASLEAAVPTDQAILDRIDPRTGARLALAAGYRRPDGSTDVQDLADLGVRSRPVRRPDNTMTLVARSDEALIIDGSPTATGTVTNATTTGAITAVLQLVIPGLAPTVTSGVGAAVSAVLFDDRWDVVNDLADRIGARVYDDGTRAWKIAPAISTVAAPALAMAVGANGTVTESETDLTRDDGFANCVLLHYEWTTGGTTNVVNGVRRITSGPYIAAVGNTRILRFDRAMAATQAQADAAAAALVARTVTRGRSFTVTGVSAYWLRPGHTVEVTLPLGGTEAHLVSAVEFDLATGLMKVTTRLPDGTYTIGA